MHTISEKFTFIAYTDATSLICPLVSFSSDHEHTIESISLGIDNEMTWWRHQMETFSA